MVTGITIGGVKLPPRVFLYGVDGVGKTSWPKDADGVVFVPTEDGCNRLEVPQFEMVRTTGKNGDRVFGWTKLLDNLRTLVKGDHEYKVVVIDTVDWAQALAVELLVTSEYGGDAKSFDAYGAGYKSLAREWRKFLGALDYLREKRGMMVILLAHATIRTFKNPLGDDYDIYKASLVDTPQTSILGLTREWADLVLFANMAVKVNKATKKATKGKGVMLQKRVVYTQPSAAYDAKVRAGWTLPKEMELSWAVFENALAGNMPAEEPEEEEALTV